MKIKLILFAILLLGCAKKGTLTGGPEDKTPPFIVHSYPANDSVNIGDLNTIKFTFSEYVDQTDVEKHFYMIPFLKYRPEFDWDGYKKVTITIKDTLDHDKTYQVILGKGYKDTQGVRSDAEHKFAITRSAKLDSLSVTGRFQSLKKESNVKLALYDTLNFNINPKYVGDVSADSRYSLKYLKKGRYIGLAFKDANNNQKPDIATEEIAMLDDSVNIHTPMVLNIVSEFQKVDTLFPRIEQIDSISFRTAKITFDEPVNPQSLKLFLKDSSGSRYKLAPFFVENNKSLLAYHNALDSQEFTLETEYLEDMMNNQIDSLSYKLSYFPSVKKDTNVFKLNSVSMKDSTYLNNVAFSLTFKFTKHIEKIEEGAFRLKEKSGKLIPIKIEHIKQKDIQLKTQNNIRELSEYVLVFQSNKIKSLQNETLKDTTLTYRLYTPDANKYGRISFRMKSKLPKVRAKLFSVKSPSNAVYEGTIEPNKDVEIKFIEGGNYILHLFDDKNRNGRFDKGKPFPLNFAEPYYIHPDTIYVRPRWEQRISGDIYFGNSF